jgi:hypothetical protein
MRQAVRPEPADVPLTSAPVTPVSPSAPAARLAAGFRAATRAGKKKVTAVVAPAKHKRLKSLALELDTTAEALLEEAMDDLFVKHGKSAG